MPKPALTVLGNTVRFDGQSDYVCLTDIAKLKGDGRTHIANWLRTATTIYFIEAWERKFNPHFNVVDFDYIKEGIGSNTFKRSADDFQKSGCIGIFARPGRYGGTYANIQWAIHFANWLDPEFYLETLNAYLDMHERLYGPEAARHRFSRELAAENYTLLSDTAIKAIPERAQPDQLFEKRIASVEADIINLAMWGMTAREWRIKFPQTDQRKNMRDYATPEELKTIAALELLSQEMHENLYTSEEKLARLTTKAEELIHHYCTSKAKLDVLQLAQHKRGWGRFNW